MAYLSNQVILEEAGNDVISASPNGGAVKGTTSSAMTVAIEEAMAQDIDYSALILVGGNNIASIDEIESIISKFHNEGKTIGAIGSSVELIVSMQVTDKVSTDGSIIQDSSVISMKIPENSEEFAELMATKV